MFGPDGMLYFSHGEGSHWSYTDPRSFRAQDLDSMAGKVFRVDPITGQGLASNPYYDGNPDSKVIQRNKMTACIMWCLAARLTKVKCGVCAIPQLGMHRQLPDWMSLMLKERYL